MDEQFGYLHPHENSFQDLSKCSETSSGIEYPWVDIFSYQCIVLQLKKQHQSIA